MPIVIGMTKPVFVKTFAALIAIYFTCTAHVLAQKPNHETETLFEESQQYRAEAVTAYRAGKLADALVLMRQALERRPYHGLLRQFVVTLALETGDNQLAYEITKQHLSEGFLFSQNLLDRVFAIVNEERQRELLALSNLGKNIVGMKKVQTVLELPASLRLVEGIAVNQATGEMFFSAVVSRQIFKSNKTGELTLLFDGQSDGIGSFFGLTFNDQDGFLYATYGTVDQTPHVDSVTYHTGLVRINPETGIAAGNWPLVKTEQSQQVADVAVVGTDVVVSDAQNKTLYKLENNQLTQLVRHEGFISPQGIAVIDDNTIVIADYGRGLWKLDLATMKLDLIRRPSGQSLLGIDGLTFHKGKLIAVQNGINPQRIVALKLSEEHTDVVEFEILAQNLKTFQEPTLAVPVQDGVLVVAASQWPKYGENGILKPDQQQAKTPIIKIPLGN